MEKYPKNRNRYFIHDSELKEMESEDKQKLIEEFIKNNSQTNYNLKRLDIAKELLVALVTSKRIASAIDLVDDAINLTDLLLEQIEK